MSVTSKTGFKVWSQLIKLQLWLQLVAQRADEAGLSQQKRLEGLIGRYKGLIPLIEATMLKIDIYSKSYAYKDDLAKVIFCIK